MPENLLWRAILCQGIKDVYDNNSRVRSEAIRWLVSRDFVTTCDNALVEADTIRELIANLATMPRRMAQQYSAALKSFIDGGD